MLKKILAGLAAFQEWRFTKPADKFSQDSAHEKMLAEERQRHQVEQLREQQKAHQSEEEVEVPLEDLDKAA